MSEFFEHEAYSNDDRLTEAEQRILFTSFAAGILLVGNIFIPGIVEGGNKTRVIPMNTCTGISHERFSKDTTLEDATRLLQSRGVQGSFEVIGEALAIMNPASIDVNPEGVIVFNGRFEVFAPTDCS